uniref:Uncharacterized protein n=1 Tax=Timema shepardi TaxID=629360 RepID=A0A7R9BC08_TIMSH|nr:unnamed protein product [Timema shepardi]
MPASSGTDLGVLSTCRRVLEQTLVNEPFVFGVGVRAVPLAAAGSEVSPGTYAVAAGWGETVVSYFLPDI